VKAIQLKIEKLTKRVKHLASERDKALGKLEAAEQSLADAGYDSVEEAQEFLAEQRIEIAKAKDELAADIEEFERRYAEFL